MSVHLKPQELQWFWLCGKALLGFVRSVYRGGVTEYRQGQLSHQAPGFMFIIHLQALPNVLISFKFVTQKTLSDRRMYAYTILNSFYTNAVVTLIFSSFVEEEGQKGKCLRPTEVIIQH